MKKKKNMVLGFSIMELVVSFMIVAVIAGASTPILFKKSSKMKLKSLNSITTKCDNSNGSNCSEFGDRCQIFKKRVESGKTIYTCALCKPNLISSCNASNKYFDNKTCECIDCSVFDSKSPYNSSSKCNGSKGCCIRCNKEYCTGCNKGVGLPEEKRKEKMGCTVCSSGTYSDNLDGVAEKCKPCPEGYYCPTSGMTDGKKYKCPVGTYCPEGSIYPKTCPEGCYCPEEKMGKLGKTTVTGLECPTGASNKTYPCTAGCYCPSGMGVLKQVDPSTVGRTLSCPSNSSGTTYPCSRDYYCPQGSTKTTQKPCNDWRVNTVTKYEGASNTSYCHCKEGLYLLNGVCTKCAKGTYKTTIGDSATLCLSCPAGYICPTDGMSINPTDDSTKKCPCGTYSTGGATKCENAGLGYYTPSANGVYTDHAICPGNSATQGSATACTCTNCSEPSWVTDTSHHYCVACATRWGANCETCSTDRCKTCKSDFYLSGGVCKTCTSTWGAHCTSCDASGCLTCQSGWGLSLNNGKTSKRCCRAPQNESECSNDSSVSVVYIDGKCINDRNRGGSDPATPNSALNGKACWGPGTHDLTSDHPEYFTANPTCPSKDPCTVGTKTYELTCLYNIGNISGDQIGKYSNGSTKYSNNYSACHRTVCPASAIDTYCYGPTKRNIKFSDVSGLSYDNLRKLQFCDTQSNKNGFPLCKTATNGTNYTNRIKNKTSGTNHCPGTSGCAPGVVFFADGTKKIVNGKWEAHNGNHAGAIRCVYDKYCE